MQTARTGLLFSCMRVRDFIQSPMSQITGKHALRQLSPLPRFTQSALFFLILVHHRACRAAMAFLRNGGSAVDGVEMALKSLEDNEITNSGFGSNLSLDGTVECDASIMEDNGRSGAVGAVSCK